jgi:subtilisin family serine protease
MNRAGDRSPVRHCIVPALGGLLVLSALAGGPQLSADDAGAAVVTPCPTPRTTSHGVTVAVVDSGVTPIPQLSGAVERAESRSFVAGEPLGQDDVHGTEMASIIHAGAPSARLLVLKALDDQDGGSLAATAEAIRYAVAHRARVINLSAAGAEPSAAIHGAIVDADQHDDLVVVAAGNDGFDNDEYPMYPANYREPNLVSVAATNGQGDLVANSDWGARTVTLGALGLNVVANTPSGGAAAVSGTSPAAAAVTAAAANVLSGDPTLTAKTLRRQLIDTSRRFPQLRGEVIGGGQLDSARLVGHCVTG